MAELKTALEEQGLKVKELDVQTGLSDSGLADRWDGHREHNLMQDANQRDRMVRLARIRRESGSDMDGKSALERPQAADSNAGLHIVA
jgi:hypothetical protein